MSRLLWEGPATVKGSPAYLSPEGFDGKLTQKSDTWAMGVMIFEMLVGNRPFRGTNNIFVLYCQVANTEPSFESIPPSPCSLVRALMEKNPQSRLSARQCFEHEWLQEANGLDPKIESIPKNLGRATSYFHRAATFSMASALGMKDLAVDYNLFQVLDSDKSGQVDQEELRAGLEKLGLRQDPIGLMASMDLDQERVVSVECEVNESFRTGKSPIRSSSGRRWTSMRLSCEVTQTSSRKERGDRLMRYVCGVSVRLEASTEVRNFNSIMVWKAFRGFSTVWCDIEGLETLRFSSFDLDGNGYIDMEELKHLLSGLSNERMP